MSAHAVGQYSRILPDTRELTQHAISIATTGTPAGVISVRARPVGADGFTKVGVEAIDVAVETSLTWVITGIYDGFILVVTTAITGGSVQLVVNSCASGL